MNSQIYSVSHSVTSLGEEHKRLRGIKGREWLLLFYLGGQGRPH